MYICRGHFLAPYAVAIVDGKPLNRMIAVDSDLMVAQRLVGYNSDTGEEITDLVRIDNFFFISNGMPEGLKDLIPEGFEIIEASAEE